jgi:hypothetical protein
MLYSLDTDSIVINQLKKLIRDPCGAIFMLMENRYVTACVSDARVCYRLLPPSSVLKMTMVTSETLVPA